MNANRTNHNRTGMAKQIDTTGAFHAKLEKHRKRQKLEKAEFARLLGIDVQRYFDLSRIKDQTWCHTLLLAYMSEMPLTELKARQEAKKGAKKK